MAEKVTLMILKVDLECSCCYKKIKKILCKFPEIRDQVYDEKQNLVKITVVCCSPEKIRDKLCCKGGKIIKSIEIVKPPPPKQPEKKPKEPEKKPKELEKKPKEPEKKPTEPEKPPKELEKSKPPPDPKPEPGPCGLYPPRVPLGYPCWEGYGPLGCLCREGYGWERCYCGYGRPWERCYCGYGRPWERCYCGFGRPLPPPPPCYDNYGYGKPCYTSRCDTVENAGVCTMM